jgi:transposase
LSYVILDQIWIKLLFETERILHQGWVKKHRSSMRQVYQAGDKFVVDYAGQTVPIVNGETGEIKTAQIVVGVLGASNYTFCEAT